MENSEKTIRGLAFSGPEDDALCKAFLYVSQDSAIGSGQTKIVFWQRIHAKWEELYVAETGLVPKRNPGSLRSRFKTIKTQCTKYAARVTETKRRRISGFTEADIMEQANISFKNKEKTVFGHHHCWRYLKDAITWKIPAETNNNSLHGNSSSQFTETEETHTSLDGDGDEEPPVSIPAPNPNQRPIGKKAAKRKIIEEGQASDMAQELRRYNNIMEAEAIRKKEKDKHMLRVFQESARREEEKADLEYLKIDTTYMPQEQREFFEHKKTEIYNKMRFRGSDSSSSGNPSVTSDFDTSSDYHVDPNP
ncbi:uncharacterized protein LOC133736207 [Rosa rugosa]|uniref:uncharacterized protein LOC133736207 n=1 Tax=Rosa rugosa TaxID=74645 RepID=UPI002B400A2B|nr:uncharacterized protein LOC133736207 [Rosa rugosa]